jgi:hypothetical protein
MHADMCLLAALPEAWLGTSTTLQHRLYVIVQEVRAADMSAMATRHISKQKAYCLHPLVSLVVLAQRVAIAPSAATSTIAICQRGMCVQASYAG